MIKLRELFNNPYTVNTTRADPFGFKSKFTVDSDIYILFGNTTTRDTEDLRPPLSQYSYKINPISILDVEFYKDKQDKMGMRVGIDPTKHFIRVLATIVRQIRHYIDKNPDTIIEFMADTAEPSRIKLYNRMVNTLGKDKYHIEMKPTGYDMFYYLIPKHILMNPGEPHNINI